MIEGLSSHLAKHNGTGPLLGIGMVPREWGIASRKPANWGFLWIGGVTGVLRGLSGLEAATERVDWSDIARVLSPELAVEVVEAEGSGGGDEEGNGE